MKAFPSIALCICAIAFTALAVWYRRDRKSYGFALGALAMTLALVGAGCVHSWAISFRDVRDFSGESVEPVIRRIALARTFADADPVAWRAFALGAMAASFAAVAVVVEWRKVGGLARGMSLLASAAIIGLLVCAHSLSLRGARVHHEIIVAALDETKIGASNPYHCSDLESAFGESNGIADLEIVRPDVRARAKSCIDERLSCIDQGGDTECMRSMNYWVGKWELKHDGETTPLKLEVLESPLLVDAAQKAEVQRRVALERSSTMR